MAENKTTETDADPDAFLESIENDRRRTDAIAVRDMMQRVTGEIPRMWGDSIVGFGRYSYTYDSGRTGTLCLTGLSPRARALSIYVMPGFEPYGDLMERLGPCKTGRSCLYVTRLDKIDTAVLEELIGRSVDDMRKKYGV